MAPRSSRKRPAETYPFPPHVRPHQQARPNYSNSSPARLVPGSSQANALVIDEDDDEEDGSQEVPDSTQGYNEVQYSYVQYGSMAAKIVGVRYYHGYATVGERVMARREPHNAYDRNAIRILNVQNDQIGHLPRTIASSLAYYMDTRSLLVEAEITAEMGHYECPIKLTFFGTNEPGAREALMNRMTRDRLPVTDISTREREAAMVASKAAAAGYTEQASAFGEFVGGFSQSFGGPTQPDLADIIGSSSRYDPRNVDRVVEEFGVKEKDLATMKESPQPDALLTQLHPFQLQGLQWMLDQEQPQLPAEGSKKIVQLWQRDPRKRGAFINVATNFSTMEPPELASGGILADDMGLGKTIQIISLIMADKQLDRRLKGTCGATLILAPVSVMSNWSTQIRKHIKEESGLRIMFYHGHRKQPITPKAIKNFDVVITTYDSVSTECHSQKTTTIPRNSGVFSVTWRRVILDEGHNIRNPKAKRTVAASMLLAQSRWVLTGTPIINNLKDLYSLVHFLRLRGGLETFEIFHSAIMRPVLQGRTSGNRSLRALMASICLRRKKEMKFIDLRLPELSEYVHRVELFPHEQEKYDALAAQAKGTLDVYKNSVKKNMNAMDTYRHLLEVLLRMRQLCNHWKLVGDERLNSVVEQLQAEGVVDLTEENKGALQNMLKLVIESQEDCPICLESPRDPVITKCGHHFCTPCIERVIDTQHKCPMCRAELESLASTTVKPAKEKAGLANVDLDPSQLADKASLEKNKSSKVEALLSILQATAKDPTNKTIVFSQWTSFFDLLIPHLLSLGLKHVRIDGSMSAVQRDSALEALDSDPSTTIMLASLSVCSVGLNLVAANQVIMADSWWAPAIEDQAVDRVHRLGQKRETKVFRLVVEGSIEEKVLTIQEEKRKLMGLAFSEKEGGKSRKKKAGHGIADLVRLLDGGPSAQQQQQQQEQQQQQQQPVEVDGQ